MSEPLSAEATERDILADALDAHRDEIVRRWLARVMHELRSSAAHAKLSSTRAPYLSDLRNAIPDYLANLARALRRGGGPNDAGSAMRASASEAWADLAREHALTRVKLGFAVEQLVGEFIVLRQVLFEVMRERGLVADDNQLDRLAALVEASLAVSVGSYVRSRDYAARRAEAEHIGFVTHEIRNPLTAAALAATRLRGTLELDPQQARSFDVLERNLRRLHELVDSVLLASRLDAGKATAAPRDIPIDEIAAGSVSTARLAAEAKGLDFHVHMGTRTLVHADPTLTASVLDNLLENAVKYTDQGQVDLSVEETPHEVVVHVRDTCPGISEEELATIFEPFHRGHSDKPGSGLGLAIARRAIEAQGGAIHAESPGDAGCHFWFSLPRALH
jgi:signal transduction histidine kinase